MDDLAEQNRVLRARVAELEAALAVGRDPLREMLLAHVPGYLAVLDVEGRILAAARTNEAFGSVIGQSMFAFIAPADHETVRRSLAEAIATRQPTTYELNGLGEDGTPDHTWFTRLVPVVEGDQVRALVMVPTDITARVRLERSLREKEDAFRVAVTASHIGLWRWEIKKNVISWDARMLEIFGVAEAPSDFASFIRLVHPDDHDLVKRTTRHARDTGVFHPFEHRIAPMPGKPERWVLNAASVVTDAAGDPLLTGAVVDITEQKRVAMHMQRAERLESVGHMTAGIAHNFNNLLAVLMPNVELALRTASGEQQHMLAVALDAAVQARELVKGLMSLAARRGPEGPNATSDAVDVVGRMITLCRQTFPREIALRGVTDAAKAAFIAMPTSDVEQVLLNLLLNARDALEGIAAPRIEVEVDVLDASDVGPAVRLRVTDNGAGMSAAVRDRMFEPFFSTKPAHRGSGLGLSTVLARVRDVRGRIDCETAPGQGTRFTLLLPRAEAKGEGRSPSAAAAGGQEELLVVDDEAALRSTIARLLRLEGYTVHEAESAARAREVLEREGDRVRLVILDQSMPGETGTQALASLRARTKAAIVLFTGFVPEEPFEVDAVLEKPARPAELLRVVREALRK